MAKTNTHSRKLNGNGAAHAAGRPDIPGQVVLVLQGGGALGAYQVGVLRGAARGRHRARLGDRHLDRRDQRRADRRQRAGNTGWIDCATSGRGSSRDQRTTRSCSGPGSSNISANLATVTRGIPAFFTPNLAGWMSSHSPLGIEAAAYYTTAPLRETLSELIDLEHCDEHKIRLTVGAVNARNGEMRYFDSRQETLGIDHVLASGALPPAFPAVRIDGDPYWDGGIYSNTPIEAVLDDKPRQDSVIFTVNMWNPEGPEPESLWQVMGRTKDIQFASRATSHIARQKQIHHLRHIIRELSKELPAKTRNSPKAKELASWGCGTTMHVARLVAPKLEGEDHTKDIDFTPAGIRARWQAGYADTKRMIDRAPWTAPVDPMDGVVIHDPVVRGKRAAA